MKFGLFAATFLPLAVAGDKTCHSINPTVDDNWCNSNCNNVPPNCPDNMCQCNNSPTPSPASNSAIVNFALVQEPSLSMKVAAGYNSGLVSLERMKRDLPLLGKLRLPAFRIDVGLGWDGSSGHLLGIFGSVVEPDPTNASGMLVNTSIVIEVAKLLRSVGCTPIFSWCYTPKPLQGATGWTSLPTDLGLWEELHARLAGDLKTAGLEVIHEIYNEPDLGWAFSGSWNDYISMFRAAAKGIRRGDHDALIIAPAMAVPDVTRLSALFSAAKEESIELSAISVHAYGNKDAWQHNVQQARTALQMAGLLNTTVIHLNELNTHNSNEPEKLLSYRLAGEIFDTLTNLLHEPQLGFSHWAQFQDSGAGDHFGTIDESGQPRASYNAFFLWSQMPKGEGRATLSFAPGVSASGVAASNASRASAAVWSTSDVSQPILLKLEGVAFDNADVSVYIIDADHGTSGIVKPTVVRRSVKISGGRLALDALVLQLGAVVYVQLDAVSALVV